MHEARTARQTGLNVRDMSVGTKTFPQLDTFYLDLQPDEAMSRVLTESHCSGEMKEKLSGLYL